jgi:hypothetical protein
MEFLAVALRIVKNKPVKDVLLPHGRQGFEKPPVSSVA